MMFVETGYGGYWTDRDPLGRPQENWHTVRFYVSSGWFDVMHGNQSQFVPSWWYWVGN